MKLISRLTVVLLWSLLLHLSCKRELSCEGCAGGNKPPVAAAGPDLVITLPADSVLLDGSASADPDGKIASYRWQKLSGPASYVLNKSDAEKTTVHNLASGVYQIELKVTDDGGLSDTDTAQINVGSAAVGTACDNTVRPQVAVKLIPVGNLSQPRTSMAVASVGTKILFAGGLNTYGIPVPDVDIYDVITNTWKKATLRFGRRSMAVAVSHNKVFFAGGSYFPTGYFDRGALDLVDIYDAPSDTWSTVELSIGRSFIAGAAAGNKVLFAGGIIMGTNNTTPIVDIYDFVTNTWRTDTLPNRKTNAVIGDAGIAATVIGNKIYFAGNASDWFLWGYGSITSTINIYDVSTGTWTASNLSISRGYMGAIAVGNKNIWAGGVNDQSDNFTSLVEIRDMTTNTSTFSCLSHPNAFFTAVQKNNKVVFFTPDPPNRLSSLSGIWKNTNTFDIYDLTTGKWSIGVMPASIRQAAIISVNNTLYVAGGYVDDQLSNRVWKLEF